MEGKDFAHQLLYSSSVLWILWPYSAQWFHSYVHFTIRRVRLRGTSAFPVPSVVRLRAERTLYSGGAAPTQAQYSGCILWEQIALHAVVAAPSVVFAMAN